MAVIRSCWNPVSLPVHSSAQSPFCEFDYFAVCARSIQISVAENYFIVAVRQNNLSFVHIAARNRIPKIKSVAMPSFEGFGDCLLYLAEPIFAQHPSIERDGFA